MLSTAVNGGHYASGKHPAGILFSALLGDLGPGLDQGSILSWIWEGEGGKLLDDMKAAKTISDKYSKGPFFKKVFDSLAVWARLTAPYVSSTNGLYCLFGKAAIDSGIIKK